MDDTTQQPTLSDYADTLIKEKNFTTLTPGTYEQIKEDVLTRLNDFLIAKVIAKMTDSQIKEFNTLLETNPVDEKIQDFINSNIQDPGLVIGDILIDFRKKYLGLE